MSSVPCHHSHHWVKYYGSDIQQEPQSTSSHHRSAISVQLRQEAPRLWESTAYLLRQRSGDDVTHLYGILRLMH